MIKEKQKQIINSLTNREKHNLIIPNTSVDFISYILIQDTDFDKCTYEDIILYILNQDIDFDTSVLKNLIEKSKCKNIVINSLKKIQNKLALYELKKICIENIFVEVFDIIFDLIKDKINLEDFYDIIIKCEKEFQSIKYFDYIKNKLNNNLVLKIAQRSKSNYIIEECLKLGKKLFNKYELLSICRNKYINKITSNIIFNICEKELKKSDYIYLSTYCEYDISLIAYNKYINKFNRKDLYHICLYGSNNDIILKSFEFGIKYFTKKQLVDLLIFSDCRFILEKVFDILKNKLSKIEIDKILLYLPLNDNFIRDKLLNMIDLNTKDNNSDFNFKKIYI